MTQRQRRRPIPPNQRNAIAVLNLLFRRRPISRAEMGTALDLAPATVSAVTEQLIQSGLARIGGEGHSEGGRRPVLIDINPSAFYVGAIDVGVTKIIAAVVDLHGVPLRTERMPLNLVEDEAATLDTILKLTRRVFADVDEAVRKKIRAIGISLPGIVNTDTGTSITSPGTHSLSKSRDVPIGTILSGEFGVPAFAENNARTMALAEVRFGTARGYETVCSVNVGYGIGSGFVVDGELYRGEAMPSSGLGHLTVIPNGPRCYCGGRGCLESLAGGYAIAASGIHSTSMFEGSLMKELAGGRLDAITAEIVSQAAHKGDSAAEQILSEAARYLGVGIASMIGLFRPQMLVIGGGVVKSGGTYFEQVIKTVQEHSVSRRITMPPIEPSALGEMSSAIGAAAIAIEELFAGELVSAVLGEPAQGAAEPK